MKQEIGISTYFFEHAPSTELHSLTRRAVNALVRGGIETMDMLCEAAPEKLLRIRNMGVKSLELSLIMRDKYAKDKTF